LLGEWIVLTFQLFHAWVAYGIVSFMVWVVMSWQLLGRSDVSIVDKLTGIAKMSTRRVLGIGVIPDK
jgi:hypothetical protein